MKIIYRVRNKSTGKYLRQINHWQKKVVWSDIGKNFTSKSQLNAALTRVYSLSTKNIDAIEIITIEVREYETNIESLSSISSRAEKLEKFYQDHKVRLEFFIQGMEQKDLLETFNHCLIYTVNGYGRNVARCRMIFHEELRNIGANHKTDYVYERGIYAFKDDDLAMQAKLASSLEFAYIDLSKLDDAK